MTLFNRTPTLHRLMQSISEQHQKTAHLATTIRIPVIIGSNGRALHKVTSPPRHFIQRPSAETDLKDAIYIFDNGFRKVIPYFYKFQAYAKARWINKPLLDVFNTEFHHTDPTYHQRAILKGFITVNNKVVSPEYHVQLNDTIQHNIHRHEPPVSNQPIKILYQDDQVLVIDKPSNLPVHANGLYRHNTVLHILQKEHGFENLFTFNRLDRLTSGLMILAKSSTVAKKFGKSIKEREIQKEYICKVQGYFPDGVIDCQEPIRVASCKLSLNVVDSKKGKPCRTIFERVGYDTITKTSIVVAKPVTGRSHQIRVHLQFLGWPIMNDGLYCNTEVWGLTNGQGGVNAGQEKLVMDRLSELSDQKNRKNSEWTDGCCVECGEPFMQDPLPESQVLFLHAWKYQTVDWSYKTALPTWASSIGTYTL